MISSLAQILIFASITAKWSNIGTAQHCGLVRVQDYFHTSLQKNTKQARFECSFLMLHLRSHRSLRAQQDLVVRADDKMTSHTDSTSDSHGSITMLGHAMLSGACSSREGLPWCRSRIGARCCSPPGWGCSYYTAAGRGPGFHLACSRSRAAAIAPPEDHSLPARTS